MQLHPQSGWLAAASEGGLTGGGQVALYLGSRLPRAGCHTLYLQPSLGAVPFVGDFFKKFRRPPRRV